MFSKQVCKIKAFEDVEEEFRTRTGAKSLPKPLVLKCFASLHLFDFTAMSRHAQDENNRRRRASQTKVGTDPQKWFFCNETWFRNSVFQKWNLQNANPNFALQNKLINAENPDRILTHQRGHPPLHLGRRKLVFHDVKPQQKWNVAQASVPHFGFF